MFILALIIGIYAYSIFILGLFYLLIPLNIFIFTVIFLSICFAAYRKKFTLKHKLNLRLKLSRIEKLVIVLFISQILINLVGALSPELAFDALWYHLTFPKIYLQNHGIFYIPGGLLYYSTIPKLIELIYTAQLSLGSEILPKLTQFSFGLLICFSLYKISRLYLERTYSLFVVLLFYSNLVIAWESTTAYIDLGRGLFELMALWGFINFTKSNKRKDLILSATMLGLAVSSKLISLITAPIFVVLIFLQKGKAKEKLKLSAIYIVTTLFVVLPWFVFSFVHTHNPVFPLITNYDTQQDFSLLNPLNFPIVLYQVFTRSADPLSPFYIIMFPVVLYFARKIYNSNFRTVFVYSGLSLVIWYFTPHPLTGGGRYIIPFLPALSMLSVYALSLIKSNILKSYLIVILIFLSIVSIMYRAVASYKFLPVITGQESRETFLTNHLNYSFGDFYDTDNYFKTHIKPSDTVFLYGFHNLYYVDFNFIDASWIKKGDKFNYIATQNSELPPGFSFWKLIYYNPITHVRLYSLGGQAWTY